MKALLILAVLVACSWIYASSTRVVSETGEFINVSDFIMADGSRLHSVWSGATNSLYIVSPDGAYTNLIMTTVGE